MAQDTNEGVAYLLALRQSGNAGTSAATAPALEKNPHSGIRSEPTEKEFKGQEKRRSQRYKCEGSAEIREEGCDVRTWATFTDISLHGCYVEAQATYPGGTALQMKLEAAGIRVETNGEVRVTYPYLGMGIAFVDMTEDNVTRLKQLLAKISRPAIVMGPGIASSLPATEPLKDIPAITHPEAAVSALLEFFESRQILLRDDFLRLLRRSQGSEIRP